MDHLATILNHYALIILRNLLASEVVDGTVHLHVQYAGDASTFTLNLQQGDVGCRVTVTAEVKYLSIEELDRIYNLNLEEGSALDQTRDFFIFQCYTALRYSDLKQLRPDNITKSDDGKFIIRLLTEKDDDAVSYPLAKRIMDLQARAL